MSPLRSTVFLLVLTVYACSHCFAASNPADEVPPTCPVTAPTNPSYLPPMPDPSQISHDMFWYGSDGLWIALPVNGTWALGHYSPSQPAFRQKMLWYRKGYDWSSHFQPPLVVAGKRLDEPAPPLAVDGPHAAGDPPVYFMTVGLNIPTTGCWEITGTYLQDKLTFVVWIKDASGPDSSASSDR